MIKEASYKLSRKQIYTGKNSIAFSCKHLRCNYYDGTKINTIFIPVKTASP
ncbi:hypothetical protein [Mucilaginibacter sp.]|uniref:hypothetical protein n=1 Tax=Mucilaginibacter sp. TaxID=1882438 RepID=UPI003B00EBE8